MYTNNDTYFCIISNDHEAWLKQRGRGIGGSDAACLVGLNPYKTLKQLWNDKKYGAEFITNEAIEYGNDMEPHLRNIYEIKHKEMDVQYIENAILVNQEREWMRYSPDGLLIDSEGRKGILEIKTATSRQWSKWNNENVPINYYIQVLHGLLVTGFDFVNFIAEIRFPNNTSTIIERSFTREEAKEDMEWLLEKEQDAWNKYFVEDVEPPLIVNI